MEKVKINHDQEKAIKDVLNWHEKDVIIDLHGDKEKPWEHEWARLNDFKTSELSRALYIGYEVEPEFKVGDWVVIGNDVFKIVDVSETWFVHDGGYGTKYKHVIYEYYRHATPQEIATEKTRRWWAKHERDALEIKQGDIIMREGREIFEVTADPKSHRYSCYTGDDSFDFNIEDFADNNWKIICFAEDRKDI